MLQQLLGVFSWFIAGSCDRSTSSCAALFSARLSQAYPGCCLHHLCLAVHHFCCGTQSPRRPVASCLPPPPPVAPTLPTTHPPPAHSSHQIKEAREVDALSAQLEALVGPVSLDWKTSRSRPDDSSMDLLAGGCCGWRRGCGRC